MVSTDIHLSESLKFINSTIAILVLYKVKLEDSSSFTTLTSSLHSLEASMDLVVYDNSPVSVLSENCLSQYTNWKIHYIHDPTNPGVSKAYNEGAKVGRTLNKKWILLLDQDTNFPPDILFSYFQATEESHSQSLFAPYLFQKEPYVILSPSGYRFKRGFPLKAGHKFNQGICSLDGKTLLSSGLLIDLMTFQNLGGYNENLKLDFSDFYFIDKFRKLNSNFYLVDCKCSHVLSRSEETSLEKSAIRFSICCEAAHHFSENNLEFAQVITYLFLRSCKLSFTYKSLLFQKILLRAILKSSLSKVL